MVRVKYQHLKQSSTIEFKLSPMATCPQRYRHKKSRESFAALRVLFVNLEFNIINAFGIFCKPV